MLKGIVRWVARGLLGLWLLALLLVGLKLAADNETLHQLDLLGWQSPPISLGVTVTIAILIGLVIGVATTLPPLLLTRRKAKQLRRRADHAQQELNNLRTAAVRG